MIYYFIYISSTYIPVSGWYIISRRTNTTTDVIEWEPFSIL